jgi:hypothetical protein
MTTLKELLDSVEIRTDDLEEKEEEEEKIDLKSIKLEDIPEKQRPIFKTLLETVEKQTNEISKRDIMLDAIKKFAPKPEKKEEKKESKENKEKEKILGVLDPDDPYAPAFKTLADMIGNISKGKEVNEEEQFEEEIKSFAQEHNDIVRYVKDMDKLLEKHPTLKKDIPTLYEMAKKVAEGRTAKVTKFKQEKYQTEKGGMSGDKVDEIKGNAKSINEAFELSEKQLQRR